MLVIKGFMPHSRFADNTFGEVAAFGEISTLALTYAREKGIYKSNLSAEMELFTFTTANNAEHAVLTQEQVDHIAGILKFIYDSSLAVAGELYTDELYASLLLKFSDRAESFELGEMVEDNNGYWMPESVAWKARDVPGITGENYIKVWTCDDAFRRQYDGFEIVVIPPTDNLEEFFKVGDDVVKMLSARTARDVMYAVQEAKGGYPETTIRAESYDYHDPYESRLKAQAPFHVLIYGAAGDNIDNINDAIVEHLLTNSTRTREEWIKILPDLFRRTEFIIVPMWRNYAIAERTLQAGIHSPTTNLKSVPALIKQVVSSYPSAHIDEHLNVTHHPFKSLALAVIGSVDNRDQLYELLDIFSDYIAVSTTSSDFGRMSLKTQNWAKLLHRMLIEAEKMGQYTSIPLEMSKLTRNGVLYLAARYENINYLVAAKMNFNAPAAPAEVLQ